MRGDQTGDRADPRPHPLDRMADEPQPDPVPVGRAAAFVALTTCVGAVVAPLAHMTLSALLRSDPLGPFLPMGMTLGAVHGVGLGIGSVAAVGSTRSRFGSESLALVLGGLLGYLAVAVLTVTGGGIFLAYAIAEVAALPALCLGFVVIVPVGRRILGLR